MGCPASDPHVRAHAGHSGVGRYHGKFSFDTFSNRRACLFSPSGLEKLNELHYPPYAAAKKKLMSCTLL